MVGTIRPGLILSLSFLLSILLEIRFCASLEREAKLGFIQNDVVGELQVFRRLADRIGIPFDIIPAQNYKGVDLPLYNADGSGKYYALFLSSREMSVLDGDCNCWVPGLDGSQNRQILDYQKKFSVRKVVFWSYPYFAGSQPAANIDQSTYSYIRYRDDFTEIDKSVIKQNLKTSVFWTIAADLTNSFSLRSIADVHDANGAVIGSAASIQAEDEHAETLHHYFYRDWTSEDAEVSVAANIAIHWATKGFFIGERRIQVSVHMDDLFFKTWQWNENTNSPDFASNIGPDTFRCDAPHLNGLKDHQQQISNNPPGGDFKYLFAFNMGPTDENDDLLHYMRENIDVFYLVSHTLDHFNMDSLNEEVCRNQLELNLQKANELFWINGTAPSTMNSISFVTPEISGLWNGVCLQQMFLQGYVSTASDIKYPSPAYSTAGEHGFEGMFFLPRHFSNFYWCTSTPANQLSMWNFFHPDNTVPTFEAFLEQQVRLFGTSILEWDPRPYTFHQGNLMFFNYESEETSLVLLWTTKILEFVQSYVNFPIWALSWDELTRVAQEKYSRDWLAEITYVIAVNNAGEELQLRAKSENDHDGLVPITGLKFCSYNNKVESYGLSEITRFLSVSKNSWGTHNLKWKQLPLANPGFENRGTGWTYVGWQSPASRFSSNTGSANDLLEKIGSWSLKIDSFATHTITQQVVLSGSFKNTETVIISFWAKGADAIGSAEVDGSDVNFSIKGDFWKLFEFCFSVDSPQNGDEIEVKFEFQSTEGILTVDDIVGEISYEEEGSQVEQIPHVVIGNNRYGLINAGNVDSTSTSCEESSFALPVGWSLAAVDDESMVAIMSRPWSTDCVVLSNGDSFTPRTLLGCGVDQLENSGSQYSTKNCASRILIRTSKLESDVDVTQVFKEGSVQNTVTIGGETFAVMDNTHPKDTGFGCQTTAKKIPDGWTLVDYAWKLFDYLGYFNPLTEFGTQSGGESISTKFWGVCKEDHIQFYKDFVIPKDADGACTSRILIRKKQPQAPKFALEWGVAAVGLEWTQVGLQNKFVDPIIVLGSILETPDHYPPALVPRIYNVHKEWFMMKVEKMGDNCSCTENLWREVSYFVVERGVWNIEGNFKIEADSAEISSVSGKNLYWDDGTPVNFGQTYSSPLVLTQVGSTREALPSVAYHHAVGNRERFPTPSATGFSLGRHIGRDTNTARKPETVNYVVVEAKHQILPFSTHEFDGKKKQGVVGLVDDNEEVPFNYARYTDPFEAIPKVWLASAGSVKNDDGPLAAVVRNPSVGKRQKQRVTILKDNFEDQQVVPVGETIAMVTFGTPGIWWRLGDLSLSNNQIAPDTTGIVGTFTISDEILVNQFDFVFTIESSSPASSFSLNPEKQLLIDVGISGAETEIYVSIRATVWNGNFRIYNFPLEFSN